MSKLEGVWDVETLVVGGIDSTSHVKNQPCYQPMKFLSDNDALGGTTNMVSRDPTKCGPEGFYSLTRGDDYLQIAFHQGTGFNQVGPFGVSVFAPEWKITKLTSEQLWLEVNYNNMFCSMHLKKL